MVPLPEGNGNGNGNGKHPERPALPKAEPKPRFDPRLLDPTGAAGKPLVFPGYEGVPFRGTVPNIKESDPDEQRPQLGMQVRVDILDLSKPEDLEYYGQISQMVGNGFAQISFEERQFIEEKKSWLVLLRWMLHFAYMPNPSAGR